MDTYNRKPHLVWVASSSSGGSGGSSSTAVPQSAPDPHDALTHTHLRPLGLLRPREGTGLHPHRPLWEHEGLHVLADGCAHQTLQTGHLFQRQLDRGGVLGLGARGHDQTGERDRKDVLHLIVAVFFHQHLTQKHTKCYTVQSAAQFIRIIRE